MTTTDRLLQLILGTPWAYAKDAGWLFVLALFLPLWQVIASFGHHMVMIPIIGDIFFWKLLVIATVGISYLAWKRAGLAGVFLSLCVLVIAATGKSPDMQATAPVITLFLTNLLLYALGTFIWTGTIFGYALAPGEQTTIATGLASARENFRSFLIFAFWLNITAFTVARAGHLLPTWFILTMLSVALILVPGALATFGHGAFETMFRLTSIAFIASIGLGIVMAFQQMGVLAPWDELWKTFRTFLWEVTDLEAYYLPWAVAIFLAVVVKFIVREWQKKTEQYYSDINYGRMPDNRMIQPLSYAPILLTTLCYGIFTALPLAVMVWLFGGRYGLYRIWRYFMPYVAFPIGIPMIYTPNQGIFIVLSALSLLLLLYKGLRGNATDLSWSGAFFLIIVLWVGVFGGKAMFYRIG
jgi:hypothetical protein